MSPELSNRVLVAGATGNLGRALLAVLLSQGREVVALVRPGREPSLESFQENLAETVTAEVTEPDLSSNIFRGVHTVISCIGITRQRDGFTYNQVDYEGNLNLLRAAERCGVKRFTYVSVVGAEDDVAVPVIQAKRRFEEALLKSELEWLIVRPSGFFTDLRDVWEMARKGAVHLFDDGESRISPIHPLDLAEAIANLLEAQPGRILSVGGPADFTWNQIAGLSFQVVGKPERIVHWPKWLLRGILPITRMFSRPAYGTLSFLGYVMTHDTTAPHFGSRTLRKYLDAQQEEVSQ